MWWQVKLCDSLNVRAMPERLGGEQLIIKRYTNKASSVTLKGARSTMTTNHMWTSYFIDAATYSRERKDLTPLWVAVELATMQLSRAITGLH